MDEIIQIARERIKEKIAEGKPLTRKDVLVMSCDTLEEVEKYWKYESFREKVEEGSLSRDDLQVLCDTAFGKNDEMGRLVFLSLIKYKRINSTLTKAEEKEWDNIKNKIIGENNKKM